MSRTILLVACLAACGTNDPGPHDVVACDPAWASMGTLAGVGSAGCERACQTVPATYSTPNAPTCNVASDAPVTRCAYAELADGTKGCCEILTPQATTPIAFFECMPQP